MGYTWTKEELQEVIKETVVDMIKCGDIQLDLYLEEIEETDELELVFDLDYYVDRGFSGGEMVNLKSDRIKISELLCNKK